MKSRFLPCSVFAALTAFALTFTPARAEIAVKNGEKIAFLGDSITAGGWANPAGYVNLVIAGLAANGVNATPIPAGVQRPQIEPDARAARPRRARQEAQLDDTEL